MARSTWSSQKRCQTRRGRAVHSSQQDGGAAGRMAPTTTNPGDDLARSRDLARRVGASSSGHRGARGWRWSRRSRPGSCAGVPAGSSRQPGEDAARLGGYVCPSHDGRVPQVRRAAERRLLGAAAYRAFAAWSRRPAGREAGCRARARLASHRGARRAAKLTADAGLAAGTHDCRNPGPPYEPHDLRTPCNSLKPVAHMQPGRERAPDIPFRRNHGLPKARRRLRSAPRPLGTWRLGTGPARGDSSPRFTTRDCGRCCVWDTSGLRCCCRFAPSVHCCLDRVPCSSEAGGS